MKKIWFALTFVFFYPKFSTAQDDGALLVNRASTALAVYKNDPVNNSAKLEEAIYLIEEALKYPEVQNRVSTWFTKGDIYITRLLGDLTKRQIDPKTPLRGDNDALVSFEAYKKVFIFSQLPNEKLKAIKEISEVQGHLVNIGIGKFEEMEFEKSFLSFQGSLESHELLKESGHASLLDDPQQLEEQVYITGMAASQANRCPDAMVYFEKLYHAGTDRPMVYEALYHCKQASGDEAGAGSILYEGREKFPNDNGLLFAEINLYLKEGRLNELTARLEQAIKLEPNNVSLYITLGNVYDNLYQSASQTNDVTNENAYFEQAKKYYSQGLLIEPQNLDVNYSLGSLYYNKAALRTQYINGLPEDFSRKGLEKMNVIRDEIMGLFDQSLPYFKKAESIDPNDVNTLIALKEIYSRKEDMLTSEEMKKRLEIVMGGGKNPSSYFNFP